MATLNRYRIYCITENDYFYKWDESDPNVCPNNNTHSIDSPLTTVIDSIAPTGPINTNNDLKVDVGEKNLFGELKQADTIPIVQNYYNYGSFNNQLMDNFFANGGSYESNSNGCELNLTITDSIYSYSVVRCKQVLKYVPGTSIVCRFNMLFNNPIANSLQFGGVGNANSDLYFCYTGTDFGVRLSSGGKAEVRILTITQEEDNKSKTCTIVLNGVSYTVVVTDAKNDIKYSASEIAYGVDYIGWNVEAIEDKVVFHSKDVGPKNGTYSFSTSGGIQASFSRQTEGVSLTTTFVNRTNWNGASSMVTDLNPLNRNMYSIEYSWYGSGNILFSIYNPSTSRFEVVHTMIFANQITTPSLSSPNMYLQQGLASLGSTTATSLTISGGSASYLGSKPIGYSTHTINGQVSSSMNKENIFCIIKNRNVYNGLSNQSIICLKHLSLSVTSNKPCVIRVYKNPDSISNYSKSNATGIDIENDDYVNYSYVNENNSLGLICNSAFTFTGGNLVDSFFLSKNGYLYMNIESHNLHLYQKEIFIFTIESENISTIDHSISYFDEY